MKKNYSFLLTLSILLLGGIRSYAQMVGDCVFMQANFVEVGVSPNGAFGASALPPAGYHPNAAGSTLYDVASGLTVSGNLLGFVADPAADGWTTGTPAYFGDYFLPGTEQEGWSIQVNGAEADAWLQNLQFGTTPYSGTLGLTGTTIGYGTGTGTSFGIWQGQTVDPTHPLQITQTTTLYTNKLYFTVHVKIKNVGTTTAPAVYYLRTVDPDNGEEEYGFTNFTTSNTIAYQLPNANNDVMVTAVDTTNAVAFLGLGTRDCRAKCFIIDGTLTPTPYSLSSMYTGVPGFMYTAGTNDVNDEGIGLVYRLGNIAAGDSTDLTYAYVLRGSDLDSALAQTSPAVFANSTLLTTGQDTMNACSSLIDTLPVNITSGDAYTWTWAPATGLTSTTGTSSAVILSAITTATTYTLIGTPISGALCSNDTFHFTVLTGVSLPPVAPAANYCQYATPNALTAAGTNLLWYTSATGGTGSSIAPTPSTSIPGTYTWWVTQHVGACLESPRVPVTVTVTPPPTVTPGSNSPVCQNTPLNFTASNGGATGTITYTWYGPNGFTSTQQNPTIGSAPLAATGTYTVVMSVNGCLDTAVTSAVIDTLPFISGYNIDTPSACNISDGVIILSGLQPVGAAFTAHYTFNGNSTPPRVEHVGTNDSLNIDSLHAGAYTNIYVVDGHGCRSNSIVVNMPDGHPPVAPTLSSNGPVCQDSLLQLFGTDTTGGITYQWSGPNGFSSNQQNPVINPATPASIGTYYCAITITATGCVSSASNITVGFKPTPVVNISALGAVCQGDTLTMASSGPAYPGATYYWTLPVGAFVAVGADTLAGPIGVEFDTAYAHHVSLTVTLNGCTNYDTTSVYVVPTPLAALYITPDICLGDTVVAALSTTSYAPVISHYDWNFDGGNIITGSSGTGGPYSVTWNTPGIKVVHVRAYTLQASCPSFAKLDTVNVHAAPDASFAGSGPGCTGDSALLSANLNNPSYSYMWTPAPFFSGVPNSPTIYAVVSIPSYVTLTVTSPYGCVATDSVYFNPSECCDVVLPEAFSPNGDHHNDRFRPITTGHHKLSIFRIVNRWGTTVYETVTTDTDGWDGTLNGVPQDMGVYNWYIKYTCGGNTIEKSGDVTLVR